MDKKIIWKISIVLVLIAAMFFAALHKSLLFALFWGAGVFYSMEIVGGVRKKNIRLIVKILLVILFLLLFYKSLGIAAIGSWTMIAN